MYKDKNGVEKQFEYEERIHPAWIPNSNIVGKTQYLYKTTKGQISLVTLPNYYYDEIDVYEIYSLDKNLKHLLPDVERFTNKKEAEERIRELLLDEYE